MAKLILYEYQEGKINQTVNSNNIQLDYLNSITWSGLEGADT